MKPENTKTDTKSPQAKNGRSYLTRFATGIVFLLLFGLLIDAFGGFYVLRHSETVYAGCVGIFVLSAIYVLGETGSNWINAQDETSHPWYKRLFHLMVLLAYAGLLMAIAALTMKLLGIFKT
jgi:hypothetical protein